MLFRTRLFAGLADSVPFVPGRERIALFVRLLLLLAGTGRAAEQLAHCEAGYGYHQCDDDLQQDLAERRWSGSQQNGADGGQSAQHGGGMTVPPLMSRIIARQAMNTAHR